MVTEDDARRVVWIVVIAAVAVGLLFCPRSASATNDVRPEPSIEILFPSGGDKAYAQWISGKARVRPDLYFICPQSLGEPPINYEIQLQRFGGAWPYGGSFNTPYFWEAREYTTKEDGARWCKADKVFGGALPVGSYRWRAGLLRFEAWPLEGEFALVSEWAYFRVVKPLTPKPEPKKDLRRLCPNVGLFYRWVETYRLKCRTARRILTYMTCTNPLCDRLRYRGFRCRVQVRKGEPEGVCRKRQRYVWWSY